MNGPPPPAEAVSPELEPIGRRLRAAREVRGVTLEDVEAGTHIRRVYLGAIEAGRARDVPGEVFLKGFLRTYANHLGLDGPALVEEYKGACTEAERVQTARLLEDAQAPGGRLRRRARPVRRARRRPWPARRGALRGIAGPAAAVLGILVLVWAVQALLRPPRRAVAPPAPHAAALPSPKEPAASSSGAASPSSSPSAPPAPVVGVQTAFARTNLGWQGTYTVSGARSLVVVVRTGAEACWVRRWKDGALIQPDVTLQPGVTATWTAATTLRILLGNAPAITSILVDGQATRALPPEGKNPESLNFQLAPAPTSKVVG